MKWLIVCIFIAKKHREVACDIIEKSINSNLKILANNDLYGGKKKCYFFCHNLYRVFSYETKILLRNNCLKQAKTIYIAINYSIHNKIKNL